MLPLQNLLERRIAGCGLCSLSLSLSWRCFPPSCDMRWENDKCRGNTQWSTGERDGCGCTLLAIKSKASKQHIVVVFAIKKWLPHRSLLYRTRRTLFMSCHNPCPISVSAFAAKLLVRYIATTNSSLRYPFATSPGSRCRPFPCWPTVPPCCPKLRRQPFCGAASAP